MYLQCKHGFLEIDRWDGAPVSDPQHQAELTKTLKRTIRGEVFIARSRNPDTLRALVRKHIPVLNSPEGWDYPYRCYLGADALKQLLEKVMLTLDYRNFKSWCHVNSEGQADLAHDIWGAAHENAGEL